MSDNNPTPPPPFGGNRLIIIAIGAAIALLAAIYVAGGPGDNAIERKFKPQDTQESGSAAPNGTPGGTTSANLATAGGGTASGDRLNVGEMRAFVFATEPKPVADVTFIDGAEQEVKLADFKGKTILLNLWATWCAPCVKEMPALDKLQAEMGGDDFEVVALSLDRAGLKASKEFLEKINVTSLETYVDPSGRAGAPLKVVGMPTTLLINAEGKEIGRLIGPAEWHTDDAKRLIRSVLESS